MLILNLPSDCQDSEKWTRQLKDWCVAHHIQHNEDIFEPEIIHGNRRAIGVLEIDLYLVEFKAIYDDWYDCRCDKWV